MNKLMDKYVIARSNESGLWYGKLEEYERVENSHLLNLTLSDARKIWSWTKAEATSGLALHAPGEGSKICASVPLTTVCGVFETILVTPSAVEEYKKFPAWKV